MERAQKLRLVLLVILSASLLAHLLVFRGAKQSVLSGYYDFAAYYGAAQIVAGGAGKDLYDYDTQLKSQQQFVLGRKRPLLFNHPAFEALFFLPFAHFPYARAYLLWALVNLVILSILPFLLLPYLRGLRDSLRPSLVVISFFSFFPIFAAILQGQDSILLLFIYTLVFISLKRGYEHRTGVLLGLGMFRPQLMIPFLLAFMVRRRWKVLSGFLIASALLALLSIQITGWKGAISYPGLLWGIDRGARDSIAGADHYAIHPSAMPNLRGFIHAHIAGGIPEAYTSLGILGISLLLVFWSISKGVGKRSSEQTGLDLPFALHLTTTILVSYHLHVHDVSLLLLPLLLVANDLALAKDFRGVVRCGLLTVLLCLFLSPVYMIAVLLGGLNWLALPILAFAPMIAAEIRRRKN